MEKKSHNKRDYYRIYFDTPLCSTMTIALINKEPVNVGRSHVCIKDISAGGLRFACGFEMPVSNNVIINFSTKILGESFLFSGCIVRKENSEKKYGNMEYGLLLLKETVLNILIH